MGIVEHLVRAQRHRPLGRLATEILSIYSVEIPKTVAIGTNLRLQHRGQGVIVTNNTIIGSDVTIYQQVTIGRAAIGGSDEENGFDGVIIQRGVTLCAGSKILGRSGTLVVGEGTTVAANAVLLESTGPNEVWAGIPARLVSRRGNSAQA